jgi:serine/threonine protein kinase
MKKPNMEEYFTPPNSPPRLETCDSFPRRLSLGDFTSLSSSPRSLSPFRYFLKSSLSRKVQNPLEKGTVNFRRRLGNGACAKIMEAEVNGFVVAVKVYHQFGWTEAQEDAKRELLDMLVNFSHPHIVKTMYYRFDTNVLHVFMERMDGNLREILNTHFSQGAYFSSREVYDILWQIVSGIYYFHTVIRLVHGDIKSENILYCFKNETDRIFKIADFDCAHPSGKECMFGTVEFMSPEVSSRGYISEKSDIWSLGMVLFEMITLELPYREYDRFQLPLMISKGVKPTMPQGRLSSQKSEWDFWLYLFHACTEFDGEKRLSCAAILDKMDAFFRCNF